IDTSGIDFSLDYLLPLGQTSSLGFNMTGTWLDELTRTDLDPDPIGCSGQLTGCELLPSEWRWNAQLIWTFGASTTIARWRHYSPVGLDDPRTGERRERLRAVDYFDL